MSESSPQGINASDELEADRRRERRLLWKGLASFMVVLVIVLVRQRYLV